MPYFIKGLSNIPQHHSHLPSVAKCVRYGLIGGCNGSISSLMRSKSIVTVVGGDWLCFSRSGEHVVFGAKRVAWGNLFAGSVWTRPGLDASASHAEGGRVASALDILDFDVLEY